MEKHQSADDDENESRAKMPTFKVSSAAVNPTSKRQQRRSIAATGMAAGDGTGLQFQNDMWHHKFQLLCAFQCENGHCQVPESLVVDSVDLGKWVSNQRQFYKNRMEGKTGHGASITAVRIAQLNMIGFDWTVYKGSGLHHKGWQHKFQMLCVFRREHGHCRVPQSFEIDSVKLGQWVNDQRNFRKNHMAGKTGAGASITAERIVQLNGIGFEWTIREETGLDEKGWQRKFQLLCAFQLEHGHCRVPHSLVIDSVKLGQWVRDQRKYYKKFMEGKAGASISAERVAQLNGIKFEWRIR